MRRLNLCAQIAILWLLNLAIIALGGLAYHYIEHPNEKQIAEQILQRFANFTDKVNFTDGNTRELYAFLQHIYRAYDNGIKVLPGNQTKVTYNWDIHSASYFVVTLVTTIGMLKH